MFLLNGISFAIKITSFQLNSAPTFNYFIHFAMISYIKQTNMHIQITYMYIYACGLKIQSLHVFYMLVI